MSLSARLAASSSPSLGGSTFAGGGPQQRAQSSSLALQQASLSGGAAAVSASSAGGGASTLSTSLALQSSVAASDRAPISASSGSGSGLGGSASAGPASSAQSGYMPPSGSHSGSSALEHEKQDHSRYMYGFRVQTCQSFLEGACPFDSYTCFNAHSRVPRRRKPQLQHGRFNYIPTRCRYVLEDKECPQVHCPLRVHFAFLLSCFRAHGCCALRCAERALPLRARNRRGNHPSCSPNHLCQFNQLFASTMFSSFDLPGHLPPVQVQDAAVHTPAGQERQLLGIRHALREGQSVLMLIPFIICSCCGPHSFGCLWLRFHACDHECAAEMHEGCFVPVLLAPSLSPLF
jgi:hypothetical protein